MTVQRSAVEIDGDYIQRSVDSTIETVLNQLDGIFSLQE